MLLKHGAQCIMISLRHEEERIDPLLVKTLANTGVSFRWAAREREIPDYLQLEDTLDKTLAKINTRTRNHLRYYRRRAEKELGCRFITSPKLTQVEFQALNRICAYPATEEIAKWRYSSLNEMKNPALYGLRDRNGEWLSLVGGLHASGYMETYWQMNRYDLRQYSLSTVMRSYMMEYEIGLKTERLYFEGGTNHSMSHSFVHERCTDLVVMRQNPAARAIPELMKRFVPSENPLYDVFADSSLEWNDVKAR
jgi:hypothetical protein